MKYFKSFLIGLLVWVVSYTISNAQTLELTVANAHYSETTFLFDIYLQATSGTVYLGRHPRVALAAPPAGDDTRTHPSRPGRSRAQRRHPDQAGRGPARCLPRDVGRHTHLQISPVDVNEVCRAAADAERPSAEAKGLRLQVETGADALFVLGDAERLRQIVRHLLDNSIKFTRSTGVIVVRARRAGSRVRISVQDDGIGIHPDALRRVFDRFWQEDGSPTRKAGGLGLGLTLVRELVRLHGGWVSAASPRENAGTTVTVEFPIAADVDAPGQPDHGTGDVAATRRRVARSRG